MNSKIYSAVVFLLILAGWVIYSDGFSVEVSNPKTEIPCQAALTYQLGEIHSQYNLSRGELADIMKEVEEVWSIPLDQDLVDFSEDGKVTINLEYSENQEWTDAERQFSKRISVKDEEAATYRREHRELSEQYQSKQTDIRDDMEQYNSAVDKYNALADKWQTKKAPSDVVDQFKQLEQQIDRLNTDLQRKQTNIEKLRKRVNAKANRLNQLTEEQNEMIDEYNERFSKPRQFDQGRYIKQGTSEQINIYQFANRAQLKTVLAHEIGHAMGLDHVSNPKSIMHAMMGEQDIFNLTPTEDDIAAIKNRCM